MIEEIKLGGKPYRLSHPLVRFRSSVYYALSLTAGLPKMWGDDLEIRAIMQELLLSIISTLDSSNPRTYILTIHELNTFMETQAQVLAAGLEVTEDMLRTTEFNESKYKCFAAISTAQHYCLAARDHLELEAGELSKNMIAVLDEIASALEKAADWVWALVVVYSIDENGKFLKEHKWTPWNELKVKKLND